MIMFMIGFSPCFFLIKARKHNVGNGDVAYMLYVGPIAFGVNIVGKGRR